MGRRKVGTKSIVGFVIEEPWLLSTTKENNKPTIKEVQKKEENSTFPRANKNKKILKIKNKTGENTFKSLQKDIGNILPKITDSFFFEQDIYDSFDSFDPTLFSLNKSKDKKDPVEVCGLPLLDSYILLL